MFMELKINKRNYTHNCEIHTNNCYCKLFTFHLNLINKKVLYENSSFSSLVLFLNLLRQSTYFFIMVYGSHQNHFKIC